MKTEIFKPTKDCKLIDPYWGLWKKSENWLIDSNNLIDANYRKWCRPNLPEIAMKFLQEIGFHPKMYPIIKENPEKLEIFWEEL